MPRPERPLSSLPLKEKETILQAYKQFSLETARLENVYQNLEEKFTSVQLVLKDSRTKLAGKLSELDFVSRYLEAILSHMSQGIIFIDLNGIVTTYNVAAQSILQIPEQELLLRPFLDFFPDTFFGFSLQAAFLTKQNPCRHFLRLNRENQPLEVEVEATFVSMSQHSYPLARKETLHPLLPIQGLLVLLRDITKVRRLEEAAHLNHRLKELGEVAAHLAHELRNPLGGIKGFATLLQQELKDRPDLCQMAEYIVQGADDLNHFVSQILTYTRPLHLHIENIELVSFIDQIRQLMQADASWNSNITFSIKSSTPQVFIAVDPQLFRSALMNLFLNSIQAMPNGGKLSVSIRTDSQFLTIGIEDSGIGIPSENLPQIFSPFFTTKESGTGLGLAEVQKVVQAHQGWIEVQSEVGHGTIFEIKVPFKLGE